MIVIWVVKGCAGTGAGIPEVIECFPGQLHPASERVPEAEGVEPPGKIGLAVRDAFRGVAVRPASGNSGDCCTGSAGSGSYAGEGWYTRFNVAADVAIAECAA